MWLNMTSCTNERGSRSTNRGHRGSHQADVQSDTCGSTFARIEMSAASVGVRETQGGAEANGLIFIPRVLVYKT